VPDPCPEYRVDPRDIRRISSTAGKRTGIQEPDADATAGYT
jgi:hypothetical protein